MYLRDDHASRYTRSVSEEINQRCSNRDPQNNKTEISHLQTLLTGLDGSNVSSDTTTDNNNIVFTYTERIPSLAGDPSEARAPSPTIIAGVKEAQTYRILMRNRE